MSLELLLGLSNLSSRLLPCCSELLAQIRLGFALLDNQIFKRFIQLFSKTNFHGSRFGLYFRQFCPPFRIISCNIVVASNS